MFTVHHTTDLVEWAIRHDRVGFSFQNVTPVAQTGETLYAECLGRIVLPKDFVLTSEEFAEDLEIAGHTASFDRHMLFLAVEWLARHSEGVLGCDISADSILNDDDRRQLLDLLRASRRFADRLVLELAISRPIARAAPIRAFCREARALGYRIALDRFDNGLCETLLALDFDIVKIDCVNPIMAHDKQFRPLSQLVAIASQAAPLVVVTGIETYAQLDIAHMAGATHVQGLLLSEPTLAPVFGFGAPMQVTVGGAVGLFH